MPTTGVRWDDKLVDLFLLQYDDCTWTSGLSDRTRPEREIDGGVEMLATRKSDRLALAIEHTTIEPFVGEKDDFHKHFKALQVSLRADDSLKVPGFALHLNMPVNTLPRKSNWRAIIKDVADWLRTERASFPVEVTPRQIPCPNHPQGQLIVQVRKVPLRKESDSFLIVQRYGEIRVHESVEKALRSKLGKLIKTDADKRLLLLERDQGWVDPATIYAAIEDRREQFPDLEAVDEVWIADTASFEDKGRYVCFSRRDASTGRTVESFTFYDGELIESFKKGMPVTVGAY